MPQVAEPVGSLEEGPDHVLDLASRLRLSTTRLARRLRREADLALSPTMASALSVINARGPLTLGALAEIERVAPPTITKIVGKMEAEGLVERVTDEEDRRVRHVECTAEGRKILQTSRARKNAWLTAHLAEISDEERQALTNAVSIIERLAASDAR